MTAFIIVLVLFITSLRNKVLNDIPLGARFALLICSLVPVWGIVIAITGIFLFFVEIKNSDDKHRLMRNSKINKWLFGEDKCY